MMKLLKILALSLTFSLLVACESEEATEVQAVSKSVNKEAVVSNVQQVKKPLTKRAQVEQEIQRIEAMLKGKSTVKGWLLVGDANMYLKRYKEAAGAYNEAYMMSGRDSEARKKLKNAMYYVGLEKSNVSTSPQ